MKVSELISFLQNLDQDKNIFLGYDRFELQDPSVEILSDEELSYFKVSPSVLDDDPKVGDYFFDAY